MCLGFSVFLYFEVVDGLQPSNKYVIKERTTIYCTSSVIAVVVATDLYKNTFKKYAQRVLSHTI